MNLEVHLQGSLLRKPIKVNALLANNSSTTYVSRRLATQLGLKEFRYIYLQDIMFGVVFKFKISLLPVTLRVTEGLPSGAKPIITYAYPLVPCDDQEDLHWEMTIGRDVWGANPGGLFEACLQAAQRTPARTPTPGPSYEEGVHFMGHNLAFAKVAQIPKDKDEYIEYDCNESTALSRIAFNKLTRQLVVIYQPSASLAPSNGLIYRYEDLSVELEELIEKATCANEGSLGQAMQEVRDYCAVTVVPAFPEDAVLAKVSTIANR